jgi:4,5-dihydroxyphthalate decarboxylase
MLRHHEFDVAELSLSSYLLGRARGDLPFIALPVFPMRMFRHSSIYLSTASGVERPQDLRGRRVGVPEYQVTVALWARAALQHEYGVPPASVHWLTGGEEQPGREEKLALELPAGIRVERIPADQTLNGMLERGELDALIAPRAPSSFSRGSSAFRRLFPNYRQVEQDYYRRTGIFPIMHLVVVREELVRQHPWIAYNLYDAFRRARDAALPLLYETGFPRYMLPWMASYAEEERALLGPDPWPYGVEPNRVTLEAATQYSHEQGLSARKLAVEELFAPTTLDEARL